MNPPPRIPASLRRFVVDQHHERYRPIDHQVWRTVLGSLAESLATRAHSSYARGFRAAGMDASAIPRIDAMHESLAAIGWSAVAVDGFIPPRAFQAFQAERILPIARDVRRIDHLAYTPAPDIVHEAAGHAPMLADPEYAEYARRIGELGRRTFRLPADDEAFEAIRALSIAKESEAATPDAIEAAEARVARAMDPSLPTSEATRLARLYWWTIEYGLVREAGQTRLYGAGLLSSPGESVSSLRPDVRKLPLDANCVETPYDITRPQPQLFVADSFASLARILDEVMATTCVRRGGLRSLVVAHASEEVACFRFAEGGSIETRLRALHADGALDWRAEAGERLVVRDRIGRILQRIEPLPADRTIVLRFESTGLTIRSDEGAARIPDLQGGLVSCHPAVDD